MLWLISTQNTRNLEKSKPAFKTMRGLQQTFRLEKKVGKSLGRSKIL
jgi:hypothetical protein